MKKDPIEFNREILKWARNRLHLTLEQVAHKLDKKPSKIAEWEEGRSTPTYCQLEQLAYEVYHLPLAVFFFPSPPEEPNITGSFRTTPEVEINSLNSDTLTLLRLAYARLLYLKELCRNVNPSEANMLRNISLAVNDNIRLVAIDVREQLGITIDQQLGWKDSYKAFSEWRKCFEDRGIFIFKHPIKQDGISGFCLFDEIFPIIYINSSEHPVRQIFSLFHELAHLLFKSGGFAKGEDLLFEALSPQQRSIEVFCNALTGEILVPTDHLNSLVKAQVINDADIKLLSNLYKVSRPMIARRLLDLKRIERNVYESLIKTSFKTKVIKQTGGSPFYPKQYSYLGEKYLGLVLVEYQKGAIGIDRVAEYFNTKAKNVPGIEQEYYARKAAS